MDYSNAQIIRRCAHKFKADYGVERIERSHADHRTDKVKIQMHHCGSLCALAGACRRDERSNACTDILTHDDGDRAGDSYAAGSGQRLKNTHGSG